MNLLVPRPVDWAKLPPLKASQGRKFDVGRTMVSTSPAAFRDRSSQLETWVSVLEVRLLLSVWLEKKLVFCFPLHTHKMHTDTRHSESG